ncbi:hypothetical protein CXB51_024455 [Gossypium anomalum]|uniref:Transposase n=1 Tax=Gossypium anomalum TaxID=47600 RepID=A0A8J5YQ29_9ROSI|nr:hypothetical protein CXB51_024455 [Gossypium anomalum]
MEGMMRDAFNMRSEGFQSFPPNYIASDDYNIDGNTFMETRRSVPDEQPNEEAAKFYRLLGEMNEELYEGSKFSKMSFYIRLFHLKCLGGWTENSLTMLLELLREMFPFAKIPQSCKDMKKVIKDLVLGYNKIHSCPNDCMLYWGDRRNQQSCHVCGKSRWMNRDAEDVNEDEYGPQSRRKPNKILRYFPLIPRFQRLFMSSKTVEFMTWHHDQRTDDGLLRHPADSLAWKSFDNKFPSFASDPRSVRLGLASDGFNPFKIMSTSYSTWPVVLVPYNLPPWLCMKQSSLILSMSIPGEKGPENDIDIYLQPLIEELKQLWAGVEMYDVLRKENFYLRAALLWTINDFLAYANLSGWSTKGRYACPCCAAQKCSRWLYNGKKFCYMGHRRWLDENYRYRFQKALFDGTEELKKAPEQTIGSEILFMLKDMDFSYGKLNQPSNRQTNRRSRDESDDESDEEDDPNEKNVCENIIQTILNVDGKSKDNLQSRLDLVHMGIRRDLHPQDIKVLDAYSSNISRCVSLKDRRLYSLKSHDYHILMQDLLPVALRCCMSKKVTSCIIELSNIMKAICGKVLNVEELEKVQDRAALTLCNLKKIFPPSFFTIMVHLVIHLPREAIIGGPSYCRNKRYPEGSIAEGYLAEEFMTFCFRYLEDVETRLNRPSRNAGLNDPNLAETYLFQSYGEPIGKVWRGNVINDEVKWLSQGPNRVVKRYSGFIMNGFRFHTKYRERLRRTQNCGVVVNSLITSYASARDSNPIEGNVEYYGLLTDIIKLDYYGKWKVVLFRCDWADANTARGIKNDQFGFIMVNFSRLIHTGEHLIDEPYVFSSQVKQVFYSKDPIDEGWYVVLRNTPRDLFDMGNGSRDDIVERSETLPFPKQDLNEDIPSTSTQFQWVRQDVDEDIYDL